MAETTKKEKTGMGVEQRIEELRLSVQMKKDAFEGLLKDYNKPGRVSDTRGLIAAMLLGTKKGLQEDYDELVALITPIVEAAPESRVRVEGVKNGEEAAKLFAFWKSYVEHPDASEKLFRLSMRLAKFREEAGDADGARKHYEEAKKWGRDALAILEHSKRIKEEEKWVRRAQVIELLEKLAGKLGDKELIGKLAAQQAVSNAMLGFSVHASQAQQPKEQQRKKKPLKPETETDYYIR